MSDIKKQIVTDEDGRPVAVQISYADWLQLEAHLAEVMVRPAMQTDLNKHAGVINLRFDPMEFQQRARDEWP